MGEEVLGIGLLAGGAGALLPLGEEVPDVGPLVKEVPVVRRLGEDFLDVGLQLGSLQPDWLGMMTDYARRLVDSKTHRLIDSLTWRLLVGF